MSFWKRRKRSPSSSSEAGDSGQAQKAKPKIKRSPPVAMEVKILALEALDSGLSASEVGELVDRLAIAPYYLALDLRYLRVFRLFRLFKLGRYARRFRLIRNVFLAKKEELVISTTISLVLLIVCSAAMYYVEKNHQPDVFSSIPRSMWWTIETLTTVGYGDVVPTTSAGKFLAAIIALIGIAFFALPSGILSAGFIEELQRHKKQRRCPHCGKTI